MYYTHKTMRTQPKIARSPGSWTESAFRYVGTNVSRLPFAAPVASAKK